jgi:hypothetical protein
MDWKALLPHLAKILEELGAPICLLSTRLLMQALSLRSASEERLAVGGTRTILQVVCWAWIATYQNLSAFTVQTSKAAQGETKNLGQVCLDWRPSSLPYSSSFSLSFSLPSLFVLFFVLLAPYRQSDSVYICVGVIQSVDDAACKTIWSS